MSDDFSSRDTVLRHAQTDAELLACYPAMRELRPHLSGPQEMLDRIARQREQGYRVLALWRGDQAIALAGYRYQDNLVYGSFLYVDDLVTLPQERGNRCGERLLAALENDARAAGCVKLVLDTALSNALAQRFYFRIGMLTGAMRFSLML
jgi:ribosomal protein S18 acetylase RimI-like enzyme